MTRHDCRRCDWKPSDIGLAADQAAEHAQDAGHWLCGSCRVSLAENDCVMCCERCLTKGQATLADIVELYALLPAMLGSPASQALDSDGRGGGESPIPGGTIMVLLAHGGTGAASHGRDDKDSDPQSVAFMLGQQEDDWRHTFGEPAADGLMTVTGAAGYLERRMRHAANSHPAFEEFLADLHRLHGQLEDVTHRRRHPVRAGADCFACASPLVRRVIDGLEETPFTCTVCFVQYEPAEYALALQAAAWDAARIYRDDEWWATPSSLATDLGRSEVTIRSWQTRGQVRSRRIGGIVFLSVNDVEARNTPKGKTA